jgi:hypothetical protein
MNTQAVAPILALVASILFGFFPLQRSRVRAPWAKALFPIVGTIGVLVTSARLVVTYSAFVPSASMQRTKTLLCGVAVGLILALILSGQLMGRKAAPTGKIDN